MKKLTLSLLLVGGLCFQATAQTTTTMNAAQLSRSAKSQSTVATSPASFTNPTGKVYMHNSEITARGGMPAVAVTYTDDFSLPNDTNGLKARGYLPYFRGAGGAGLTGAWFQGTIANWGDYNTGSTAQWVASNYNSVTGANNIDNWLVTPALNISVGDIISFYSRSPLNSTFPDSIRVMYSAVGDSTPEALTWVELGNFESNTAGAWAQNSFIAPTAGATGRFAIRYNVVDGGPTGANSDLIGIDQLDIFTPATFDLLSLSVSRLNNVYTSIPLSQATPISLSGEVKNNGITASTGGSALFEIIDTTTLGVVYSETVNLPNLNPGANATLNTVNTFTPVNPASLRARLTVNYPGDGNTTNDEINGATTTYSDSTYARDNGESNGSLGIGAGPADGIVGQNFEVIATASLTSVSFKILDTFDPNPAGTPVYATIHAQTAGSEPSNTVLATTDSILILPGVIAPGGDWFTLNLDAGALTLAPGLYYVGVHEVDSNISLGYSAEILTPLTVWVSWNTIPAPPAVNGWASADDFNFFITYNLRLNMQTISSVNEIESNSSLVSLYPSPTSNEVNIRLDNTLKNARVDIYNAIGKLVKTFNNVNDVTRVDVSTYATGIYSVLVSSNGKSYTNRFTVAK